MSEMRERALRERWTVLCVEVRPDDRVGSTTAFRPGESEGMFIWPWKGGQVGAGPLLGAMIVEAREAGFRLLTVETVVRGVWPFQVSWKRAWLEREPRLRNARYE